MAKAKPPGPRTMGNRQEGRLQVTAKGMTKGKAQGGGRQALRALLLGAAVLGAAVSHPVAGLAQGAAQAAEGSPFATVLKINDSVITRYELDQRMRFLMLLRAPGDPEAEALKGLMTDRLAAQEARRFGLRATPEEIAAGQTEFAGRANLTAEQFIEALGQGGVAPETFRDFVTNGLLWRNLVRAKFGGSSLVSETEIDRAIANGANRTAMQLLFSEIIIPVEGDPEDELALARSLRDSITSEADFAAAARRHSRSPSAGRGGRLDWVEASNLPPQIVQILLASGPDRASEAILLPEAVALFQLRDVTEDQRAEAPAVEVEYAEYLLPNTATVQADAQALSARVDTCNDLYAEARGQAPERLTVTKSGLTEVPRDIALELAQLDPGEYSAALTRGGWRVFLMLCGRAPQSEAPIDRNAIRDQLTSQELARQADGWLEELRSEAILQQP